MSGQSCQDALSTRTVLQPCPKACAVGRRGLPACRLVLISRPSGPACALAARREHGPFPGLLSGQSSDNSLAGRLTCRTQYGRRSGIRERAGETFRRCGQDGCRALFRKLSRILVFREQSRIACARDFKPQPAGTAFFSFCPGLRGRAGAAGMHIGDFGLWKKMFVRQHRNVWP